MTATRENHLTMQPIAAGLLAAFIGFASSFAVVLKGLEAAGASPAEAASGLMALSLAMGLCAILLSLWDRQPISVAWSTPGAALLASSPPPHGGFAYAVGGFVIAALLAILAGLWKPLERAVAAIPRSLANGMLAGVLFEFCLAPAIGLKERPVATLAILLTWVLVGRVRRLLAVPAAVVVTIAIAAFNLHMAGEPFTLAPHPLWVTPHFSLTAALGIGLPLFIVTMASQNIPGLAILHMNGYAPPTRRLFSVTGLASLVVTPFGGLAVNLAAITATLCAGPDAHPDPRRRWPAAMVSGIAYVVFAFAAGPITAFVAFSSPVLIAAVAGIALFGALGAAVTGATAEPRERDAAMLTFVIAASGVHILGIGGAFWGLIGGAAVLGLQRWRRVQVI